MINNVIEINSIVELKVKKIAEEISTICRSGFGLSTQYQIVDIMGKLYQSDCFIDPDELVEMIGKEVDNYFNCSDITNEKLNHWDKYSKWIYAWADIIIYSPQDAWNELHGDFQNKVQAVDVYQKRVLPDHDPNLLSMMNLCQVIFDMHEDIVLLFQNYEAADEYSDKTFELLLDCCYKVLQIESDISIDEACNQYTHPNDLYPIYALWYEIEGYVRSELIKAGYFPTLSIPFQSIVDAQTNTSIVVDAENKKMMVEKCIFETLHSIKPNSDLQYKKWYTYTLGQFVLDQRIMTDFKEDWNGLFYTHLYGLEKLYRDDANYDWVFTVLSRCIGELINQFPNNDKVKYLNEQENEIHQFLQKLEFHSNEVWKEVFHHYRKMHIRYPKIDKSHPSTLTKNAIFQHRLSDLARNISFELENSMSLYPSVHVKGYYETYSNMINYHLVDATGAIVHLELYYDYDSSYCNSPYYYFYTLDQKELLKKLVRGGMINDEHYPTLNLPFYSMDDDYIRNAKQFLESHPPLLSFDVSETNSLQDWDDGQSSELVASIDHSIEDLDDFFKQIFVKPKYPI